MLEIPMTQPSAKANRAEKPSSSDETKTNNGNDQSEADFDEAYASESDAETQTRAEDAPKGDVTEEKAAPSKEGAVAEAEVAEPDVSFDAAADEAEIPPDTVRKPVADESGTAEKVVRKTVSDTSELAFAQRVLTEKGSAMSQEAKANTATQNDPIVAGKQAEAPLPAKTASVGAVHSMDKAGAAQASVTSGETAGDKSSAIPSKAEQITATAITAPSAAAAQKKAEVEQLGPRAEMRAKDEPDRIRTPLEATAEPKASAKAAAATASATVQTVTSQPIVPLTVQSDASGLDMLISAVGEVDTPSSWDPRNASTAALAQTLSRPETPGMIGRQMAEILQRFPDRPVELSLNPEELGRVRLSISTAEGGITVHVLAERPETLDLMRRHIDQLAREFQALGYQSINFAFNEGQSDQNTGSNGDGNTAPSSDAGANELQAEPAVPIMMTPSSGVDLRL